jgi:acetyltransferase-like isoleucine patch superfamily enzyme
MLCDRSPGLYRETRGGGRIQIGDDVVISRGVHIVSYHEITIGSGSGIGEYISLRDANHSRGDSGSLRDSGHQDAPIHIGHNVWIERGVTILPGVSVGDEAVVGANAVVTRDVAAGCAVAGIPARPLRVEVAR